MSVVKELGEFLKPQTRFFLLTLGCKVNQSESEELFYSLKEMGLQPASSMTDADIIFINSCAVTSEAEAKTRKAARRALKAGATAVAVLGCAADFSREKLDTETELKNKKMFFVNNKQKRELLHHIKSNLLEGKPLVPYSGLRTRSFVKIQDGCNQKCSYCIVPLVRGSETSVSHHEILRKLEILENLGVKEVVLTGVHLGRYRSPDDNRYDLPLLLEKIASEFDFRIRLSSIDVFELSDRLIKTATMLKPKICPHFHIPLQSGSDRILKLMRRPYTSAYFLKKMEAIKNEFGTVALSTDVMVGFPTETEEDFHSTVKLAEAAGFMKLHVFRYSVRPGTPAASLFPRVPAQIVKEREEVLLDLSDRLSDKFLKTLDGLNAEALVEDIENNIATGKTEYYVDVKITSKVEINQLYPVKIKYRNGELLGEVVK